MTTFADVHSRPFLLPNAWDFASAAAFAARGYPAVGTTSLGVAAAAGIPDGEGLAREETLALARRLVRLPCMVTVDIETGFSDDPAEVAALTRELAGIGVVGVNIEDGLGETGHRSEIIAAAKTSGLFVNARTDTHWLKPHSTLTEALERVRSYVDAGADCVFIPGLSDENDIAAAVGAVDVPLNVLYLLGGPSFQRLAELGVRRVSCGSFLYRAALSAAIDAAGTIAGGGAVTGEIISYAQTQALSGS